MIFSTDKMNWMDIFLAEYIIFIDDASLGKESSFQGHNKLLADYVTRYSHHINSLPAYSWKKKQASTDKEL